MTSSRTPSKHPLGWLRPATGRRKTSPALRWVLGWIPFWAYNAFVFWSAIVPRHRIPRLWHLNDKILHAGQYFFLFFFSVNAFQKAGNPGLAARAVFYGFVWCLLMGMFTEWAQYFVPGRSTELGDWLGDAAGAAAAVVFLHFASRALEKREIL